MDGIGRPQMRMALIIAQAMAAWTIRAFFGIALRSPRPPAPVRSGRASQFAGRASTSSSRMRAADIRQRQIRSRNRKSLAHAHRTHHRPIVISNRLAIPREYRKSAMQTRSRAVAGIFAAFSPL
ncbi:hypothetical protein [Lysobacter sp. CA196]|uniref:hypothetical protein n=1 Tax=Lysobacter sp. CA196 TaxID=3455606 RepID=UPI003F8D41B9